MWNEDQALELQALKRYELLEDMNDCRRKIIEVLGNVEFFENWVIAQRAFKRLGVENSGWRKELLDMFVKISNLKVEALKRKNGPIDDIAKEFKPIAKRVYQIVSWMGRAHPLIEGEHRKEARRI